MQTAPAVRVQLGEELGLEPGDIVTGQMVAGLRRLGFDKVFDTVFTADLTIIEEGNELLHRIKTGGVLPMITSCSPAWIKFAEHFYPDQLDHLSTCKSPQQMFGAMAKTYYADKMGLKPDDVFVVSIMPCTAKKFEAARPEMRSSGTQDVDVVLTTRELGRMLRQAALDFARLDLEEFDAPLGIGTGAGEIFGASGGVMEAALRTVAEVVLGKPLDSIEFADVRGLDGVKETTVTLGDLDVRVAVTNGLGNARKVMDQIRAGTSPYHFIEVMSCPGGCIGGGGGPIPTDDERRLKRIAAVLRGRPQHADQEVARKSGGPGALRGLSRKAARATAATSSCIPITRRAASIPDAGSALPKGGHAGGFGRTRRYFSAGVLRRSGKMTI